MISNSVGQLAVKIALSAVALAASAVAGSAQATNYIENLTGAIADFSPISGTEPGYYSYTGATLSLSGFTEIPVATIGDTIDVTVTLDHPYTIPASASYTGLLLYLSGGPGGGGQDLFNWTFYNGLTPVATLNSSSTTSGDVTTFGLLYPPDDHAFTFTSFTDNITIGAPYNLGPADLTSASFEYNNDTAIPEPAAWALMLVGFAGLGAALRRRRETVSSAI